VGLDWKVGHKPAPGHEAEGWAALRVALRAPGDESLLERWFAIPTVPSWVTIDAPRVGDDQDAAAWFLRRAGVYAPDVEIDMNALTDHDRALLAANANYYVVALAVVSDGTPPYSHGGLDDGVDETSFRAAFLEDAAEVIGPDLLARAYQQQLPDEFLVYANALARAANRYALAHRVVAEAAAYEPPAAQEGPASKAHIVASAARWCRFWADRGHWLDPWF
jgi:hypothetical protein